MKLWVTVVDVITRSHGSLLQRKLPEQDIAQGSYIALPLTLLLLLAGYNHDKVGPGVRRQTTPVGLVSQRRRRRRAPAAVLGSHVSSWGH